MKNPATVRRTQSSIGQVIATAKKRIAIAIALITFTLVSSVSRRYTQEPAAGQLKLRLGVGTPPRLSLMGLSHALIFGKRAVLAVRVKANAARILRIRRISRAQSEADVTRLVSMGFIGVTSPPSPKASAGQVRLRRGVVVGELAPPKPWRRRGLMPIVL